MIRLLFKMNGIDLENPSIQHQQLYVQHYVQT